MFAFPEKRAHSRTRETKQRARERKPHVPEVGAKRGGKEIISLSLSLSYTTKQVIPARFSNDMI